MSKTVKNKVVKKIKIDSPDWKDAKTYSFTKEFDLSQWAWEFLRRIEAYKESWNEFELSIQDRINCAPELKLYIEKYAALGGVVVAVKELKEDMFSPSSSLRNKYSDDELLQIFDKLRSILKESLYEAHRWGLEHMLDPNYSLMSKVKFNVEPVFSETGTERKNRRNTNDFLRGLSARVGQPINFENDEWLNQPFQLHMRLDMRIPIGVIKKHLKKELERQYENAKNIEYSRVEIRERSAMYLLYLRTLDALHEGKKADEIAAVLFNKGQYGGDVAALRKQMSNTIKQARETRDKYLEIAHIN